MKEAKGVVDWQGEEGKSIQERIGEDELVQEMFKEKELEKEIKELEEKLKDREDALPAHSVQPQQMLLIEELETSIEEKKNELAELKKAKFSF
ncbi:MAG: hypothetical protein JRJ02_10840 [Deltaproteobacteria bacterium]|nr:hypothetical protein [Deltaproteobacteria bacterium]